MCSLTFIKAWNSFPSSAFWKVISVKARAKLGVKSYIQIIAISIWADCLPCVSVIVPPSYTCLYFASSVSLTAITSGCIPNTTGRVGGCAAWDVIEKWLCRFRIQRYTSFSTLPFMYKENTSIMSVGVCRDFLCECFLSLKSANAHIFFFLCFTAVSYCSVLLSRPQDLHQHNFCYWTHEASCFMQLKAHLIIGTLKGPVCNI